MKFFRKLFGSSDPMDRLRRLMEQKCWAEALAIGNDIEEGSPLTPEGTAELKVLLDAAGDALAELNLTEGEACLRVGDRARATEHFSLAAEHARSGGIQQQAQKALTSLMQPLPSSLPPAAAKADCHSGHSGCSSTCHSSHADEIEDTPEMELDSLMRLELILSSYPQEWTDRYLEIGETLREAFLLAHEGREEEAVRAFDSVPARERDDLFFFERGALHGRMGDAQKAFADLKKALELNPDHSLALETLIHLEMATGKDGSAESRLKAMLSQNLDPGFCHGNLAILHARRGELEKALDHGMQAIAAGGAGPETLQLAASLLERAGRIGEAERVLMGLSGGGCSGGANPLLAEFWLRHNKNLDKALEAFKDSLRHEPGNPRWLLRVSQVYLAKGWKKEGNDLLDKVLASPELDPRLREEGLALMMAIHEQRTP